MSSDDESSSAAVAETQPPRPRRRRNRNDDDDDEASAPNRSVARHVRARHRAVAEREAARLARPTRTTAAPLGHANRRQAAVTSTPFGVVPKSASAVAAARHDDHDGSSEDDEDGDDEDDTGRAATAAAASSSQWCGPLAVARQIIAARERQRRRQQRRNAANARRHHPLDAAMEQLRQNQQRQLHPSLQWKPHFRPTSGGTVGSNRNRTTTTTTTTRTPQTPQPRRIPTLQDLCLDFVVQHFEFVESLGPGVPHDVRSALGAALTAHHALDGAALAALYDDDDDGATTVVEIADAAQLTAADLVRTLQRVPSVSYLHLAQCGRCFTGEVVDVLCRRHHDTRNEPSTTGGGLQALSIGGAYLWTDAQASRLWRSCRNLSSLAIQACPLWGLQAATALAETYSYHPPRAPLVELALTDVSLSDEAWDVLTAATSPPHHPHWAQHLKRLSMVRTTGLTDARVTQLLAHTASSSSLQALELVDNYDLTDATLEAIRLSTAPGTFRSLQLAGLKLLSATALEALFTPTAHDYYDAQTVGSTPPCLTVLRLAQLDAPAVTDDVVRAALKASGRAASSVVRLDLEGASALTDAALEDVVTYAAASLEELNLSYCTGLTDQGMGYLLDGCGTQLRQVDVWGLAQLTDALWKGYRRCRDPTLVVTGVWMKKSSWSVPP